MLFKKKPFAHLFIGSTQNLLPSKRKFSRVRKAHRGPYTVGPNKAQYFSVMSDQRQYILERKGGRGGGGTRHCRCCAPLKDAALSASLSLSELAGPRSVGIYNFAKSSARQTFIHLVTEYFTSPGVGVFQKYHKLKKFGSRIFWFGKRKKSCRWKSHKTQIKFCIWITDFANIGKYYG